MSYQVPLQDMAFLARSQQKSSGSNASPEGSDSREQASMILEAAAKLAQQQWLPCNRSGDQQGCLLENGKVQLAAVNSLDPVW